MHQAEGNVQAPPLAAGQGLDQAVFETGQLEVLTELAPEVLFATEPEANAMPVSLDRLAKVPVVKLGERGCRIFDRRIPAPSVPLVDGTGAGDAFAAAFCVAYLEGATPLEAAGRAVLVAARAVTQLGARP